MSTLKGKALIDFGLRDSDHPEGSCTDSEYNLSLALQNSVDLLREMYDIYGSSDNEICGEVELFLQEYN